LFEKNVTQAEIARLLQLIKSIVSRVLRRHSQCGSVENRSRTGRPPLLSPGAKRVLFIDVRKSRNAPLQEITNIFNQGRARRVSKRTVQRALRAEGYQRRVIRNRKAIQLRLSNNRNRVAWCRGKLHLPVIGYWDRVIFIDEFKVEVRANKRVYVWRRAGEEWDPTRRAW